MSSFFRTFAGVAPWGWPLLVGLGRGFCVEAQPPAGGLAETNGIIEAAARVFNFGDPTGAVALLSGEITRGATNPQLWFARGRFYQSLRQSTNAIADFGEVLRRDPRAVVALQLRAAEEFKLGQLPEALADWNRVVQIAPSQEPWLWQRGIVLYLLRQHSEAQRQFELHRKVNTNDVEAIAWHMASVACATTMEAARQIRHSPVTDSRVPMREILALFAGDGTPAAVLAAAKDGATDPMALVQQLFYAHYYLALFHEASGDVPKAREHARLAAEKYAGSDFMGDTARIHYRLLTKASAPALLEAGRP
jgi:tetratricopeptide (TPR) repeat protein